MDAAWVGSTASSVDDARRRRWLRPLGTTATATATAINAAYTVTCRIQLLLTDRFRSFAVANVEPICLRPAPGVTTNAFSIENLLRRRHYLVERVAAGICSIGVAARLDSLYFR
ncbi:hypothetical protein ACRU13_26005 [Mycobacterium colombiense]|uniref:hypothetical protein n=1 Tax=Mycobacterium colombiense TaxID=339268 RepID=UPI001F31C57F|nr:hypothetical protein [Mycobacterium colombiense]